ncbi:hypothetical protein LOAG_16603 [Loa loa]|uniref:CCHC-type domain-containing protein n=1 Tax=Loa loa TaxID=7209 RepID=A0A1I7VL02_LOALO|nr:hypothetical protein LOAG_16603 [Loa loa]EJD76474.1 hypothetical protein LOAG_16603 [Loa loa]
MSSQELSRIAKSLITVTDLEEVKRRVRQLWKDGQLEKLQAAKLIRRWRSRQWQNKQKENREALINSLSARLDAAEEQTLDDVKQLINEYLVSGKIAYEDGALLIKKWRKRQSRRIKRQLEKGNKSCCFFCRQTGHKFSECPERDDEIMGSGICFKCGSTEHISSRCHRKNVRGFPYATCFVCRQQGHLSRDCDKNANGIYPDGGSCNLCGSQKHLKKHCPLKKDTDDNSQTESLVVARNNAAGGDDDLPYIENSAVNIKITKKLERKVVHV